MNTEYACGRFGGVENQTLSGPGRSRRWARFLALVVVIVPIVLLIARGANAVETYTADATLTELNGTPYDLAIDVPRGLVYVSIPWSDELVVADLNTGSILESHTFSEPIGLDISSDGAYLYVALHGVQSVARVDLSTWDSTEVVLPGLISERTWDVLEIEPDVVIVSAYSGARLVRYDFRTGTDSAAAMGERIAYFPIFAEDPTGEFVFVADEGHPSSLYKLDIADPDLPIVAEDDRSLENRSSLAVSPDGSYLVLGSGQQVETGALTQIGMYDVGVPVFDDAGDLLYVFSEPEGEPSPIQVFDPDTSQELEQWNVPCTRGQEFSHVVRAEKVPGSPILVSISYSGLCFVDSSSAGAGITGNVTDAHTSMAVPGICVGVHPFGHPEQLVAEALTDDSGQYSIPVPAGTYQMSYLDCERWDYAADWFGAPAEITPVVVDKSGTTVDMTLTTSDLTGLVDVGQGLWSLAAPRTDIVEQFYFGNPGDYPFVGDWDCDGIDTPGMYRQSDGYVYLRNTNTQGIADIRFFFGNPGDVPLAGDFNGDGCDTVSIYRPSEARFFIINELGQNDGGLGAAETDYLFGNPGDKPFVGDFDADGVDTVGLHRESTGLVYFRNSHTQGNADTQYIFGNPGDRLVAGNFSGFWLETPAVFRPSSLTFYIRHTNTAGNADRSEKWGFAGPSWYPVAGVYGLSPNDLAFQSTPFQFERDTPGSPRTGTARVLPRR